MLGEYVMSMKISSTYVDYKYFSLVRLVGERNPDIKI